MQTFKPNPAHYTLQDAPGGIGASCSQCALYSHELEHCGAGPTGTWVDQCTDYNNLHKIWVLRPEIAEQ